jgi:phytoene synthase
MKNGSNYNFGVKIYNELTEMKNHNFPIIKELKPVIQECDLPAEQLEALIDGMEMDLTKTRYDSWEELAKYCYHVASVVGLLSVKVFGYQHPSSDDYGYHLGQALQLTNILRDVRVDAEKGRIYLPQELLKEHDVSDDDILNHQIYSSFQRSRQSSCRKG